MKPQFENVDKDTLLMTDELRGYKGVEFTRLSVNHSAKEYVNGMAHTNGIESVWSLLKRAWYGTHHHYNKKYMPLYVAEMCWKYNQKKDSNTFGVFLHGCFA